MKNITPPYINNESCLKNRLINRIFWQKYPFLTVHILCLERASTTLNRVVFTWRGPRYRWLLNMCPMVVWGLRIFVSPTRPRGQCHQADWERNPDHKPGFSCSKSRFDIIKEITMISRLAVQNPVPRLIYKETLVSKRL